MRQQEADYGIGRETLSRKHEKRLGWVMVLICWMMSSLEDQASLVGVRRRGAFDEEEEEEQRRGARKVD